MFATPPQGGGFLPCLNGWLFPTREEWAKSFFLKKSNRSHLFKVHDVGFLSSKSQIISLFALCAPALPGRTAKGTRALCLAGRSAGGAVGRPGGDRGGAVAAAGRSQARARFGDGRRRGHPRPAGGWMGNAQEQDLNENVSRTPKGDWFLRVGGWV